MIVFLRLLLDVVFEGLGWSLCYFKDPRLGLILYILLISRLFGDILVRLLLLLQIHLLANHDCLEMLASGFVYFQGCCLVWEFLLFFFTLLLVKLILGLRWDHFLHLFYASL